MAKREIKTTLKLEGEQDYKKAVGNVNSQLKVLSSEMKTVNSRYDANEKSMRKLKEQSVILEKQFKAQTEKVDILKKAVEDSNATYDKAVSKYNEMVEKYGENSKEAEKAAKAVEKAEKAVQNFTIQLNNAQANLAVTEENLKDTKKELTNLKNVKLTDLVPASAVKGVEAAEEKLRKAATAAQVMGTACGNAAINAGKLGAQTLGSSLKVTAEALGAYASAAAAAATAVFNLTAEAALFADDINTMSKQTGLDTETLQSLTYAADLIDVDVETVAKSMARLTKNMTSTSSEVQGAFESLGVTIRDDVTGELRNNEEVFNEIIDALGKIENETERDNIAMQIFGKSAQDLNPLILGGAEQFQNLADSAKNAGLILSQDALDNLNEFNDSLDILKGNLSASKNVLAGNFSGNFKKITDEVGQGIPAFTKALSMLFDPSTAEEGEKQFREIVDKLSDSIGAEIEGMLPVFLNGINVITSELIVRIPQSAATLLPYFVDGLKGLVTSVVERLPELVPQVAEGAVNLFTGLIGGLNEVIAKLGPMIPGLIRDVSDKLIESIPLIIETGFDLFISLINGLTLAAPEILKTVTELVPVLSKELTKPENLSQLIQSGIDLIVALAEGIPQALPALITAVGDVITALANEEIGFDDMERMGVALGETFVNSFSSILGVIDSLLGTNLQKWYDDVAAFWRDAGAKLYEVLHADELESEDFRNRNAYLNDDIVKRSNQYMREGMSPEEALERAKNEVLDTAEKQAFFDQYLSQHLTVEHAYARFRKLQSTGQIGNADYYTDFSDVEQTSAEYYEAMGRAALAEREFDETAEGTSSSGSESGGTTINRNVVNNFNSPTALSAQEQLTLAEKMKQLEDMYS